MLSDERGGRGEGKGGKGMIEGKRRRREGVQVKCGLMDNGLFSLSMRLEHRWDVLVTEQPDRCSVIFKTQCKFKRCHPNEQVFM